MKKSQRWLEIIHREMKKLQDEKQLKLKNEIKCRMLHNFDAIVMK